jgi:hypothetical protein
LVPNTSSQRARRGEEEEDKEKEQFEAVDIKSQAAKSSVYLIRQNIYRKAQNLVGL